MSGDWAKDEQVNKTNPAPTDHRSLTEAEKKALRDAFDAMPDYTTNRRDERRLTFLQLFADLYNSGVRARELGFALGRPYQPKHWKTAAREAGIRLRTERLREV